LKDPGLIEKIIHPEDRELFLRHFEKGDGELKSLDFRIVARSGEERWISHVCQPVFSSDGRYLGRRGSNREITKRIRAEEALAKAKDQLEMGITRRTAELEEANTLLQQEVAERRALERKADVERRRLNDLLETLPAYVVLLTPDYRIPFANRIFRELFGESHGKRCFEHLFGRSQPCESCETFKVLQKGEPHRWEWTGPDGRNYEVFDYPFTDADGSPLVMEMGIDVTERKCAEEALRVAGESNRRLIEASLDPLVTIGPDGTITDVNAATEAVTGYSRTELIGTDFSDYFTEPHKARAGYRQAFEEGLVRDYALEIRHRHGQVTPVLYNASVYRDDEGKIMGVFAAARDITKRKQAEEALRAASEYNRSLIEASLDPLVTIGPDGTITDVNAATEAVTGYSRGELIGTDFSDYFTEPYKARAGYKQVFEEGLVRDYALEIQHRYGQITPVLYNASVYRDDAGKVIGVFAAARDITQRRRAEIELDSYREHLEDLVRERTRELEAANVKLQAEIAERKKAEEEMRESEEKYRSIVETANEGISIVDPERRMIYVNDKLADMLGYSPEELIGRRTTEFTDQEGKALSDLKWELRQQGIRESYETLLIRKDGSPLWIIMNAQPLFDVDGEFTGSLNMLTDITERKKAEEALQKAKDELEQRVKERTTELSRAKEELEAMNRELQAELEQHRKLEAELVKAKDAAEVATEAKAAFLANMSHELRTPMNSVIGYSSLLLDEDLTPEQKEHIEGIRKGGEALLAVISDILEFSRTEKEEVKLEQQPFGLRHCIEESLNMVAVQAEQKGLNLAYTINYGTPDSIIGDQGRVRHILVNLLSNAVKFTDKGYISVSVSSKRLEGNDSQVCFTVSDTGIGVPQDKLESIFQPFSQVEYLISRKRDGAGLGLAICKRLVQLMGGEIWAESEEGKGSTFRFTIRAEALPDEKLDLGENERASYENLPHKKTLRILVAEDNPSNRKVLVTILKRLGYRADAVADGQEVLQALKIRPYDLIFMDIRMPEMDGISATREIRSLWPEDGPKVIAVTAFAMDGDKEKCLQAGMDGYIAKPVKVSDIASILQNTNPVERIKGRGQKAK
jgi:PAS domain S-box-containing protein